MSVIQSRHRSFRELLLAGIVLALIAVAADGAEKARVFIGTITDTECGADHRPMIARGHMGETSSDCTRACVRLGATYGFVLDKDHALYQLDDQEKPAPFAGKKVRLTGRREGDTIFVERIRPLR